MKKISKLVHKIPVGVLKMSFITKSGEDAYDKGSPLYYVFQVMIWLYAVGYVASLILIQNANVPHTFFKNNNNGILYETRFSSLYWFSLMFSAMRIFVIVFLCLAILFRKTTCCGCKYNFCTSMWLVLLVVVLMFDFLSLSALANYYSKCNGLDQLDNPCNDLKWCCANEIFSNPANLCGNTCAAFIPYNTLVADVDFVWLFSITVVFCAFDLALMLIPVGLWLNGGVWTTRINNTSLQYDLLPTAPTKVGTEILQAVASTPLIQEYQTRSRKRAAVIEQQNKMTKQM